MCFSWDWLLRVILLAIVMGGIFAILQLIVPYAIQKMGATVGEGAQLLISIFRIALWVIITCVVVIIAFQVIACLWSMAGGGGGILPHR